MTGGIRRTRTARSPAAVLPDAAAPAAVEGDSLITVLDNSQADSVPEVDRTADVQAGSGTAGSHHADGGAVDVVEALVAAAADRGDGDGR
ncbi:hypothetical protein ACFSL4_23820 [Streptomyces caeni]|uniref:Uncharacterized protein n=1 Tax=Streptomyces caeni TaxID=2307231 RepID=A0ABW4IXA7_9ACTN